MGNSVFAMEGSADVRVDDAATTASARSLADRITLATVIVGAIAVVLLALPYKAFDLDRFFVPKELVLHATAAIAGLIVLARRPRPSVSRVDTFLVAFVGLSVISALFAENWWLATRALAITASGVTVFWVARALAAAGYERALVSGLASAVVAGAVTALLQAYGVEPEYVSLSRAPGGTFGNRNFMAHLSAIGTPIILLCDRGTPRVGLLDRDDRPGTRGRGARAVAIACGVACAHRRRRAHAAPRLAHA